MGVKQPLFLLTVLLVACGVIFWTYNAPTEYTATGYFEYLDKVQTHLQKQRGRERGFGRVHIPKNKSGRQVNKHFGSTPRFPQPQLLKADNEVDKDPAMKTAAILKKHNLEEAKTWKKMLRERKRGRGNVSVPEVESDLEKKMRDDLNLCNDMYTEDNATMSDSYAILRKRHHMIQDYLPEKFSDKFRNPCWYGFHPNFTSLPTYASECGNPLQHNQSEHDFGQVKERHLYCLPAFFLSGFPKSASTTLYEMISQHPLVARNKCKAHHFWNGLVSKDPKKQIHLQWYLYRFSQPAQMIESNPLSITLDGTPVYAHSSSHYFCMLPVFLKRVLPEAMFIFIMRNPSERYFSHYWYKLRGLSKHKGNTTEFNQYAHTGKALEDFHDRTVDAITNFQSCVNHSNSALYCIIHGTKTIISNQLYYSLYYYHIKPWINVIPYERFLFLRKEDLANAPSLTMSKVWRFLQLDDFPTKTLFRNVNQEIKSVAIPQQTKELLDKFFQPHNQLLAHLLSDKKYLWND